MVELVESRSEPENFAPGLLRGLDYDAQFRAIRSLLSRQERADRELENRIKEVGEFAAQATGAANERAVDEWVDLLHGSLYQHAAHSMTTVGMIVSFLESVFRLAFQGIGRPLPQGHLVEHVIKGVKEVGMEKYIPDDLEPTLSALFTYRNKMFHNGFEWSPEERQKFEQTLNNSGWPSDWFSSATIDGEPWMFYMSPEFIDHCLDRIRQIIEGIEKFALDRVLTKRGIPADKQEIYLDIPSQTLPLLPFRWISA